MWSGWQLLIAAGVSLLSATTYGLYLLISLLGFGKHWNEAFSSFAHRGYKSMLRLRIGGSAIFRLGSACVDRWKDPRNPELNPHIIERPITLA